MTLLRTIHFVGLGLMLGLGACTTTPEPTPPVAAKAHPVKPVKTVKKPVKKPVKPEAEPAEVATAAPAATIAPPQAVVTPPPQPLDVVGKSEADVIALLGQPADEQVASAAKVMRFTAEGCAVEIHLFPDVKQGGYRVLETSGGGSVPAPQCLGKVRAGRG